MRGVVVTILIGLCLLGRARADVFEPPSTVPQAQDHYDRGKALFRTKQYTDAAKEFTAAYELDPSAKFLLFNLGLARRLAGACREAIVAYESFLNATPPDHLAKNAQTGIDRCKKVLSQVSPSVSQEPEPPEPTTTTDVVAPPKDPVVDVPVVVKPEIHVVQVVDPPKPVPPIPTHWYRDGVGDALVGTGIAAALGGAVLYALARHDASATSSPGTFGEFQTDRDNASRYQTASWITASVGGALIVVGLVHYATRPAIVPTDHGAVLGMAGRF